MTMLTSYWSIDLLVLFLLLLATIYLYMSRHYGYWKKRGIPHHKPKPFFGTFKDMAMFKTAPGEFLANMYNKTTDIVYGTYAFHQPYLIIRQPELIKNILVKDFNYFTDRTIGDNHRDDPSGTYNLFIIKNPDWKTLRTKLTPTFSSGKIKQMFTLMQENGVELVSFLKKVINKGSGEGEAKDISAKYTTDVIMNCVFGIKANCLTDEDSPFRIAGKKILTFNYKRAVQFFSYFFVPSIVKPLRFKFIDGEASGFLRKVFNDSMKQRMDSGIQRNDLIDVLIKIKESDNTMVNDKLLAQGIIFLSAGFESSSSVISFTLYELCLQPDVQKKLQQEIKTVLAKHNGDLSYEAISEMNYLDMVVCETLRKYPPLPFLDRRCMKDYKIPGSNIVIEKGIPVCIPLLGLHYDPVYFPDPQKYDPERFSESNRRNIVSGSYMPFGLGPHNCIGERFGLMSSKLGLIKILSNFEVERNTETPAKIQFDPKSFLVTSKEGLHMNFKSLRIPAA